MSLESLHRIEGKILQRLGYYVRGAQNHMEEAASVQRGTLSTKKTIIITPTRIKSPFPYKIKLIAFLKDATIHFIV